MDSNTGDVVHVDFNCLFEKVCLYIHIPPFLIFSSFQGKSLETPEKVPFRLTQNMVDGLGITGVEGGRRHILYHLRTDDMDIGVFRIACEVTMQLLRDNKDSLMSVLDAFIHDPLVEWEDEKRKLVGVFPPIIPLTDRVEIRNGSQAGGPPANPISSRLQ